jgi:hypothetical protein
VQGDADHPVDRVVDPEKNYRKTRRAEEEERHKGSHTPKNVHGTAIYRISVVPKFAAVKKFHCCR